MAANKVESAFRLPSRVNEDFIRNLLWQHLQEQQQENINQFTTPPSTTATSERSSGNTLDETEETFIHYFKSSHEDMF